MADHGTIVDFESGEPIRLSVAESAFLRRAGSRPSQKTVVGVAPIHRGAVPRTSLTARDVGGILAGLRKGKGESWSDLVDHMLETDGHLTAVYQTRLVAISGSDLVVQPGEAEPGDEELAEAAADFIREDLLDLCPYFTRLADHLLHANGLGWAVAEHRWRKIPWRGGIRWHSDPIPVLSRDVDFVGRNTLRIRTYDVEGNYAGLLDVPTTRPPREGELDPHKLIIHFGSRAGVPPHRSGDLLTTVWPWFFKHNVEVIRQKGLARFAVPVPVGILPAGSGEAARSALLDGLRALQGDEAVALEEGTELHTFGVGGLDSSNPGIGKDATEVITSLNAEQTKALLGSTDNVEAGEGSFARAKSQAGITVVPRFWTDQAELASTILSQWARHTLRFNAHLFGGVVPPTPRAHFQIVAEEPTEIPTDAIVAGLQISQDEYRASFGLDPRGPDGGGHLRVRPQAKVVQPGDSSAPAPAARASYTPDDAGPPAPRRRRGRSSSDTPPPRPGRRRRR